MKNNNLIIREYEPQQLKDMNINDIVKYLANSGDVQALKTFCNRLKELDLYYFNYRIYLEDNYINDYTSKDVEQFYNYQADVIDAIYVMDNDIGNVDISTQYIAQDIEDSNLFTVTEEGYKEV